MRPNANDQYLNNNVFYETNVESEFEIIQSALNFFIRRIRDGSKVNPIPLWEFRQADFASKFDNNKWATQTSSTFAFLSLR